MTENMTESMTESMMSNVKALKADIGHLTLDIRRRATWKSLCSETAQSHEGDYIVSLRRLPSLSSETTQYAPR